MSRIILLSYRSHVAEAPERIAKPTWYIPPTILIDGKLDLDFTPLILSQRVVVDAASFERLSLENKPQFRRLRESLRVLSEEGYVEFVRFEEVLTHYRPEIERQVDKAMRDPLQWVPHILSSLDGWIASQPKFAAALGSAYEPHKMPVDFGIYCYLMNRDGVVREEEVSRLMRVLTKRRRTAMEKSELHTIVRPHVSYIHVNLALSEALQTPIFDWHFMSGFYTEKYESTFRTLNPTVSKEIRQYQKLWEMFEIALPSLRPTSVSQIVRLLKDPRIGDLQEVIATAAESGLPLTREWGDKALIAATLAHIKVDKVRKVISLGGLPIDLFAPAGGLISKGIEYGVDYLTGADRRKLKWALVLIESLKEEGND